MLRLGFDFGLGLHLAITIYAYFYFADSLCRLPHLVLRQILCLP